MRERFLEVIYAVINSYNYVRSLGDTNKTACALESIHFEEKD